MRAKRLILLPVAALLTLLFVWNTRPGQTEEKNLEYNDTYKNCRKKTKIGFLKTHKCASSSIQNILIRFAVNNSLNVVLPSQGNYLGRYIPFTRSMISNTPWELAGLEYDIFCLHTIWNQDEVANTLGPGTTYFTMLRDPVELFESLWNYASFKSYYHISLEEFAFVPKTGLFSQRAYKNLGRNQMLWDLGLTGQQMDNYTAVEQKIKDVELNFDLVLIAERFEESMILMKDLLCWEYRDILNLKLNARDGYHKSELSIEARHALEDYLAADYRLYNHFRQRFSQRVQQFGQHRMEKELNILRHANENMKERCGLEATINSQLRGEEKLWGPGLIGYHLENSTDDPTCRYMAMSENSFLNVAREEQSKRTSQQLAGRPEEEQTSRPVKQLPGLAGLPMDKIDVDKLQNVFGAVWNQL